MKKFLILSLVLSLFVLSGCGDNSTNTDSYNSENVNSTYTSEKVSISKVPKNEPLSSFSTTIYSKDNGRQTNVNLTCSILNGYVVKAGQTFSFCDVVGKATPERGYQKAEIFDGDGNIVLGYGGGNCQVSSTLYNVVLNIPSLEVVERHPHAKYVPYVEEGKDAAVACGSVDFKFKNNNNYDIKIYASATTEQVTISIMKI